MTTYPPTNAESRQCSQSQDNSSSPQSPIPDVGVESIIDQFSQSSPKTTAKFIFPAAEIEIYQEAYGFIKYLVCPPPPGTNGLPF